METFACRGVVLKEIPVGEADKLLVLLLKDRGKVTVSGRGARKQRSKLMAGSQLFTYAEFVIVDGSTKNNRRFYSLSQADIIEGFYELRNNLESLCYANYFAELTEKIIIEGQPVDEILQLITKCYYAMAKKNFSPSLCARIFELKFLQYNGYAPEVSCCSSCGSHLEDSVGNKVLFGQTGALCQRCAGGDSGSSAEFLLKVSKGALYTAGYVLSSDRPFSFEVTPIILNELKAICTFLISRHFEVNIKSLELIRDSL